MATSKIIVAFHIGRGGRFNNSGFKTFIGEKNFQDLINLNANNLFYRDRDEKGKFCTPHYTDHNGSHITDDDINGKVGMLNFDNDYDTDYCKYIEDCDEAELQKIAESNEWKSYELTEYLSKLDF